MTAVHSKIILQNVKIYGYHGVLPEENIVGTYYILNLELGVDIWKAAESDDLNDTVSYAEINEILHQEMKTPSKLIEHVAGRIITKIEQQFPEISGIKLRIMKTSPPMHGSCDGAAVEFYKTRKENN